MPTRAAAVVLITLLSSTAMAQDEGRHLWDGNTLDGWEQYGEGQFVVENGMLKSEGGFGLLWYAPEQIGDAALRVVYKLESPEANSGVYIRLPSKPDSRDVLRSGYEIQINNLQPDPYRTTGSIHSVAPAGAHPANLDDWNTLEITLDGPRTAVHLNGVLVSEYREGDPRPPKVEQWEPNEGPRPERGYIGLQNYRPGSTVYFKEVSLHPLP